MRKKRNSSVGNWSYPSLSIFLDTNVKSTGMPISVGYSFQFQWGLKSLLVYGKTKLQFNQILISRGEYI